MTLTNWENTSSTVTRRHFIQTAAAAGLTLSQASMGHASSAGRPRSVIHLSLVGGPSQLDTWDPKPNAPLKIRGPFRSIATSVPGIHLTELFPKMARQMDQFALLRSVYHNEAPIHETGHQLIHTGHLITEAGQLPHFGAVASKQAYYGNCPQWVGLPHRIGNTGVSVPHGQSAGPLGQEHEAAWLSEIGSLDLNAQKLTRVANLTDEPSDIVRAYGNSDFGRSCLKARRLVEAGVRVVSVNMFSSVFNAVSWDMHANGTSLRVGFADYKNTVCPSFDQAFTALLTDLSDRGLLEDTLVVASGEFGRTPTINKRGGRDHWPGCWTALVAGGGTRGGQVIGASDSHAAAPVDRPIHASELAATMFDTLGLQMASNAKDGASPQPIRELF